MRSRAMRRLGVGGAALLAAVATMAGTAGAGAEEAPGVEVTVPIGGILTVSGTGCLLDGVPGEVDLGMTTLGNADQVIRWGAEGETDASGAWRVRTQLPDRWRVNGDAPVPAREGTYRLVARCWNPDEPSRWSVPLTPDIATVHVLGYAWIESPTAPTTVTPAPPAPPADGGPVAPAPSTPPSSPARAVKAAPAFTG